MEPRGFGKGKKHYKYIYVYIYILLHICCCIFGDLKARSYLGEALLGGDMPGSDQLLLGYIQRDVVLERRIM